MKGTTHLLGGASTAALIVTSTPTTLDEKLIITGIALIASILPDIDIDNSMISHLVKPIRLLHKLIFNPFESGSHRGITHSLLYGFILTVPFMFWNNLYAYAFFGGIMSHILFDMLSGGSGLFEPFIHKRIKISHIKTGSMGEIAFAGIYLLINLTVFLTPIIRRAL